jgi:thiol-disulfide isomerase/thioredoxin
MAPIRKRPWLWAGLAIVALFVSAGFMMRDRLFLLISRRDGGEMADLREEWVEAREARFTARQAAKSEGEKQAIDDDYSAKERQFVEHCRTYATSHAGTAHEIGALKMLACRVPDSQEGKQALEALVKRASTDDLALFEQGYAFPVRAAETPIRSLALVLSDRVKKAPNDAAAAHVLASIVCGLTAPGHPSHTPPADFAAAADLLVARYADSPDIYNFCEIVGTHVGHPPWAGAFETHLRTILDRNRNRAVRVAASFALANVVQAGGEKRQLEAERLYQNFVEQFDGSVQYTEDGKRYAYAWIEKDLNQAARRQLVELSKRGVGKPAPEIVGVDLGGNPMKLSDFRGKTVLLSFWATSCGPCLKLVPYEHELLSRFEGKSFTIVGVNCDDDPQLAQKTATAHEITWRCFRDNLGEGRTISTDWQNSALPMFYLIDRQGIIKRRWVGTPLRDDVNAAVSQLTSADSTAAAAR